MLHADSSCLALTMACISILSSALTPRTACSTPSSASAAVQGNGQGRTGAQHAQQYIYNARNHICVWRRTPNTYIRVRGAYRAAMWARARLTVCRGAALCTAPRVHSQHIYVLSAVLLPYQMHSRALTLLLVLLMMMMLPADVHAVVRHATGADDHAACRQLMLGIDHGMHQHTE